MGPGSTNSALALRLRRRLRRPAGITQSTRWLFAGLVLMSLALALPPMLSSARGVLLPFGLGSAVVLASAWTFVYLTENFALWVDVLITVGITGFALTCPAPAVVVPFVFASVWFGALYGSASRSIIRIALYFSGMGVTLPLWHFLPGHPATPGAELLLGAGPSMVITVIVGRHLAVSLEAREQSLRRDATLATLGSQLLAVRDPAVIRALASGAAREICAATPGLRILHAVRDGAELRVELAAGEFAKTPLTLPWAALAAGDVGALADSALLDAAAGTPLQWVWLRLDDKDESEGWTLLGAPGRLRSSTTLAARSLMVMVALALRNSDVHQELSVQARVDSLTGLANRAAFTATLSEALEEPAIVNPVHLLFLDLDDFKHVNDGLGHRAGDEVLREVAVRLRACTRTNDVCARLGGDEFAVILIDTLPRAVTEIAQRMVQMLTEPINVNGHIAQIGASIGIAASHGSMPHPLFTRVNTADTAELCHQADVAMYAAKANGKGQIQWFDAGLLQTAESADRQLAAPA